MATLKAVKQEMWIEKSHKYQNYVNLKKEYDTNVLNKRICDNAGGVVGVINYIKLGLACSIKPDIL